MARPAVPPLAVRCACVLRPDTGHRAHRGMREGMEREGGEGRGGREVLSSCTRHARARLVPLSEGRFGQRLERREKLA